MKYVVVLVVLSCGVIFNSNAQSKSKKKKAKKSSQVDDRSNSFSPYEQGETISTKKAKSKKTGKKSFAKNFNKNLDQKVDQFHERMEANAKAKKKIERKKDHPMYSDPSYFGHKKKPKKRPAGKRKFCKECKIVH